MEQITDYSRYVKFIRDELLITQEELAEMLGVTFATVNRWENGHFEPSTKKKRALRDICVKHNLIYKVGD